MKMTSPRFSDGTQLPPLGKAYGAIEFERLTIVDMTFLVEMVVD